MKNVETIKAEMNEVMNIMEAQKKEKKKVHAGTLKKYRKLNTCKMYMVSNPTEEFVNSEKDRIAKAIEVLFNRYVPLDREKYKKKQVNDALKQFEKENGIPLLRTQLSTLRYILS